MYSFHWGFGTHQYERIQGCVLVVAELRQLVPSMRTFWIDGCLGRM